MHGRDAHATGKMDNIEGTISEILKGKAVIVGIGNALHGDDGIGPALVGALSGEIDAECIDGGNAPENFTGTLKKLNPDTILIIDAVHLDLEPGEYRFVEPDDLAVTGFSTHSYSLSLFIEYLQAETSARIYLLGIQPKSTGFNTTLSKELQTTLEKLTRLFVEAGKRKI